MSTIYWHENPAFDAPELNSPQPCIHGAGCVFTVKNAEGKTIPGSCRYVHPGEEGNGRCLFPANDKKPACVRLTGNAGFYKRRRLKMSWQAWCELKGIPFVRNEPGVRHAPVKRIPFTKDPIEDINIMEMADTWPSLPNNEICSFCGDKVEECGDDHGDDMRHWAREERERRRGD